MIFAHITVTIHRLWSIQSYFNTVWCGTGSASINFDQSLKLGVKMGIRKWRISKSASNSLTVRLKTKVSINR
jgi:hypothetical protein